MRAERFIDIDPDDVALSPTELEFRAAFHAMRARRSSIYLDWRPERVPSVTLEQGAWLLLGHDPWKPQPEVSSSFRDLREFRHRELLNLLECGVAANALRPIGKRVDGFERRFRLVDVADYAMQKTYATEYASEILEIIQAKPARRQHYETIERQERLDAHRRFVASVPQLVSPVDSKDPRAMRRKGSFTPVNCRMKLFAAEYDQAFRDFCDREVLDLALRPVSPKTLANDRRELNIQVRRGRPPKLRSR